MQIAFFDTDLSDAQWEFLEPMLPAAAKTGRPRTSLRKVLNAILYLLKTGAQWRSLPSLFPPRSTVHGFFLKWSVEGTLEAIHHRLRAFARAQEDHRSRPTAAILDSQTIRSAGYAEEVGYDAAKKTKGRKRFLLVDSLGLVLTAVVTPADVPEREGGKQLLDQALGPFTWLRKVWVDSGFSGADFAEYARTLKPNLEVEVVARDPKSEGFHVLARRWVVERTFGWLVLCRRLVRDYERRTETAVGWIHLAMIRIMLRRLA